MHITTKCFWSAEVRSHLKRFCWILTVFIPNSIHDLRNVLPLLRQILAIQIVISAGDANIMKRRTVSAPYFPPSLVGRYRCFRFRHFGHTGMHQFTSFRISCFDDTTFSSRSRVTLRWAHPNTLVSRTGVVERIR